jgi:hypothetical protein
MNITLNGRVYHVENELELREFLVWWAVSGSQRRVCIL